MNLIPANAPADIYQQVADLVAAQVVIDAAGDSVDAPNARGWVGHVTRKVVKRPVMTLAYGASPFGFREQVFVDTVRPWKKDSPSTFPWAGTGFLAAQYLGSVIWKCVGDVVVAARRAMEWLQAAAKIASAADQKLEWTTPAGFPVNQHYEVQRSIQIRVQFRRVDIQPRLDEDTGKIDARRQAAGLSPNWVHSLDAAHLMRTVNAAHALGMRSFSMIHDSYGTHAGNAQALAEVLREEFVRMYKEKNWLADFAEGLMFLLPKGTDLPPLPTVGSLDLDGVLESPFFFA